jgi:GR25 family glycosyltransferase involved in LPS biosynthesis
MKRRDFIVPLLLLQVIPTSVILHRLMADHFASYREAGYEDTVVDIDAPDVDLPILADVFDEQYQSISTDKERKRLGAGSSRDATPKKTKPKEKREPVNLPPTFWVNLDTSVDRRKAMMASFSSLGIIENTHRVPASNVSDMMNMLNSGQLVFHPKIKLEPATEKTWEKQYHYNYQEAACLLSHLRAIKQAYDEGHELALFLEDDASLPSTFVNEWVEYIKLAPKDWKVLQFAPSNKVVVKQLAKLHDPFISWQKYSWSTRAYMVNREGMKTLMDKIYLLSSEGEGIWSLQQQKPMVVSDEVVYSVIGDAHTSTGLRVDGLSFNSTVQEKSNPLGGVANTYRKSEISDLAQQVAMKKETKVFDQSLLVLMNVRISNEADIEREVGRIAQDVDAVCKFHHKCTWEVNLVATDSALMNRFIELSSEIPPNVNFQETVSPSPFNKFSFIKKFVGKMADFDLVLIKDNDQRTSGFPWQTFVGRKGNAIVAGPLRKTASEGMQQNKKVTKRQWFSFHEAKHWTEPNRIFAYLFMSIKPTEVPLLEQYFVLFDAKFASFFFNITLTPAFVDQLSAWGPDYLWCQAAAQWGNNTRPGCYLIPVVSSHDDTRQISKTKEWIEAGHKMLDAFRKDPPFTNWMKPSDQWSNIIGNKGHYAIVRRCCNLTGQNSCDTFENLQTCSMWFANE